MHFIVSLLKILLKLQLRQDQLSIILLSVNCVLTYIYALIPFLVHCSDNFIMTYSDRDVKVEAHSKIIRDPIYKLALLAFRSFVRSVVAREDRRPFFLNLHVSTNPWLGTKCFDARQHPGRRARFRSGLSKKIECDCFDRIFQDGILIQKDSRIYAVIRQDMLSSIFLFRPLLSPQIHLVT